MKPDEYDPAGVRNLAYAVVTVGVEDVLDGDDSAALWLHSPDFEHWCNWIDLDPDAAREALARRLATATPKYDRERMSRVVELHKQGVPWHIGTRRVFGYYSQTLVMAIKRHVQQ